MVFPDSDNEESDDNTKMTTERKRFELTPTPTTETISILDKPMSQLSMSQEDPKKTERRRQSHRTSSLDMTTNHLRVIWKALNQAI